MDSVRRRYTKDEFAERGDLIYENDVRPYLTEVDEGKLVAVDIESGFYEVAEEELEACDRLRGRIPNAQIWMVRVGSRGVHRFGGRDRRVK